MGASCTRPVPIVDAMAEESLSVPTAQQKEEKKSMILVGKPAPKFKSPAFYQGEFTQIDLADYAGKWVMLCFYPGDFTFV